MREKEDFVIFKGVRFTFQQGYYRTNIQLHREIWRENFGEIPEDHHIHHKNGNTRDNRIENLECLPRLQHLKLHNDQRKMQKVYTAGISKEARRKQQEWANSKRGKKIQSRSSRKGWANRKPIERVCIICGNLYFSQSRKPDKKYCSPKCSSSSQRTRELITLQCIICNKDYQTRNRPALKGKTCSYHCRGKLISKTKSERSNDFISST